ncbi:patatin-like phospholipase family protein [Pokkaliibacter sp. MBI-7]|uniref:patatin-like phospholipase family protein n=1 Tax=Pokkaliibacter sp. MBI-7 TaxID=3040600 RepID=UPI002449796D|nr:patatin-like phospholipase family protein [Pokkaliibacter sp. MBI-7]MDH2434888.1 patatin-like phospholipase family protein [Pokkaliibacter sp. MBI-7]
MARLFQRNPQLNLALQGGGAHGAFTWGVLDYLLEDGYCEFEGISGTSAGAMNAVAMAHGWMEQGREGARQALQDFWQAVASSAPFQLASQNDNDQLTVSPALNFVMGLTHYFSPYQLNPMDHNPLRKIVESQFDFARLSQCSPFRLFIAATNANTGHLRLFHRHELTADALLASACLPTLHHSIEIEGEPYWDGGYSANPAIFPLFYECKSDDILLILLSPMRLGELPRSAQEIKNRAMDIAFNSAFLREMRMIVQARDFAGLSWLPYGRLERNLARIRFHMIDPDERMFALPTESKLVAYLPFFEMLRDMGRVQAALWMDSHRQQLGKDSTIDLKALFGQGL